MLPAGRASSASPAAARDLFPSASLRIREATHEAARSSDRPSTGLAGGPASLAIRRSRQPRDSASPPFDGFALSSVFDTSAARCDGPFIPARSVPPLRTVEYPCFKPLLRFIENPCDRHAGAGTGRDSPGDRLHQRVWRRCRSAVPGGCRGRVEATRDRGNRPNPRRPPARVPARHKRAAWSRMARASCPGSRLRPCARMHPNSHARCP
jgi:hypothetical protein